VRPASADQEAERGAVSSPIWERALIWGCFVATVLIAIWSSRRGFDFLDTGCYFLEYKFPKDVADTHTTYHLIARPFFLLVRQNVVYFRYLSWFFIWASAAVMGWGLWSHFQWLFRSQRQSFSLATAIGVTLLASATNYAIKPAALTYNSLNFVAMAVALGLFFDGITRLSRDVRKTDCLAFAEIAGAALAATIDILVKPTTAVFLDVVIVGYCAVSPSISWRAKKQLGMIAMGAAIVGVAAMILFVGGWGGFIVRVNTLTGLLENHGYMDELYARVWREFGELGRFLAHDLRFAAVALVGATIVLVALRRRPELLLKTAGAAGFVLFFLWLYSTIEGRLWRGSHNFYYDGVVARLYLGATLLATTAAVISRFVVPKAIRPNSEKGVDLLKVLLWLILIFTPFAGAFGTTTSIYLNGALYSACWFGALLLAIAEVARIWRVGRLLPWATIPFAFYAVALLFHGQIYSPYMYPVPLWKHTIPTAIGDAASVVLMDPASNEVINGTRKALEAHGFKSGDDIFCFFNIPGLVYAVGGRSPVVPWYFGRIYGGNTVEEIFMQQAGPERRAHAWLITQADVTQFREHFHRGGINFPEGYEEIASLVNPQSGLPIKIWMPRGKKP
jgi:hypothetical protein